MTPLTTSALRREVRPALRVAARELHFFRLTWKGTSFTMLVAPSLFLVALGVGLGGLIGDEVDLGGIDYLSFITPGLLVAAASQLAGGSALWPVMAGHRWIGFHRAMVSSPIGSTAIVSGYLFWLTVRSTAQGAVVLSVGAALGAVDTAWAVLAAPVAGLTAAAIAAPLMAYTASCDSDKAFDPIMRVGITPLYLFSGTFFPTDRLPDALEWVVRVFPVWHGIELARVLATDVGSTVSPVVSAGVIATWIGAGWLAARRTFRRRLTP